MTEGSSNAKEISLGDDFGDVVIKVNGFRIEIGSKGVLEIGAPVTRALQASPANDTAAKAAHEIGDIERDGEHKGEIYGGILPSDNKPIWFSAAPKLMDHYAAAAWAREQGGSLPTRKQGDYLTTLKGKGGAFTEIFNRRDSFPAGVVWLAEPYTGNQLTTRPRDHAWCLRLSGNGNQDYHYHRNLALPVLSVRR